MNFYSFHIGDYASKTRHLSWDENLAYRLLIEAYYAFESPLPMDRAQVYRLISANTAKHKAAVDAVISEFFQQTTEGFRHERCDEEIAAASAKRAKASQSARMRWDSEGNANASAHAMRTHSEGNAPNPITQSHHPSPNPNPITPVVPLPDKELERLLREAAGWQNEPAPMLSVTGPIQALISKGADLNLDVLPVVKAIALQAGSRTSWKYFVKAIAQAHQARTVAGGTLGTRHGANGQAPPDDAKWVRLLDIGRTQKVWQIGKYGPFPNQPDCRVPPHLLKPGDGEGWTEWRPE